MTRIRLRPGLHYAPIDTGVYVAGARASFVMTGPPALFRVVDACLPLLEDGTDVDQLVAALGRAGARPLVERLVETFDSRGLLLHPDQLQGPQPGPDDRERYAEALAYLETYRDQPYADFTRIRSSCVLVAGPPEPLGPAVRGLVRSGVGRIVVVTPEPGRLAPLARRHPEVQLGEGPDPDIAVIFSEDSVPSLPPGCVVVPVRIGKDLAVVGPAMNDGVTAAAVERLWERAANWCLLDRGELLVRPSGDLLAGALAAHVTFAALCGMDAGQAHVVHGADLVSETIRPVGLVGAGPRPAPETATELGWMEQASQPWTGLFRLTVPGVLPQMPVALTLAEGRHRAFDDERVIGFGPNQQESTTEAALEALRHYCRREGPGTAAAGVDQAEWLLDGALRLLAELPSQEQELPWPAVDDIHARRLWRLLEGHELTPVRLATHRVAGFGWVLVSVRDRRDGVVLGRGWGPTLDMAAIPALSSALARLQVRRTVDPSGRGGAPAGLLRHAHAGQLEDLGRHVTDWLAASGCRLRSRRVAADPVAGPLPAWCGMVWLDG